MILNRKSRLSLGGLREEGKTGQEGQRLRSQPSLATCSQLMEGRALLGSVGSGVLECPSIFLCDTSVL